MSVSLWEDWGRMLLLKVPMWGTRPTNFQLRRYSIGRATRRIVKQSIAGAIGVKSLILIAGACGFVTLWAAVFAGDVGVVLLAVLNSVRILSKKFE